MMAAHGVTKCQCGLWCTHNRVRLNRKATIPRALPSAAMVQAVGLFWIK